MQDRAFPGLPESDRMPRRYSGWGREIMASLVILLALFIGWHVVPAWLSKDNAPIACQFDGGQWSIWNGWQCG